MFLWNTGILCLHTSESVSASQWGRPLHHHQKVTRYYIQDIMGIIITIPDISLNTQDFSSTRLLTQRMMCPQGCFRWNQPTKQSHNVITSKTPVWVFTPFLNCEHTYLELPECVDPFGHLYIYLNTMKFTLNSVVYWESNHNINILTIMDQTVSPNIQTSEKFLKTKRNYIYVGKKHWKTSNQISVGCHSWPT
jgi:hypothetical protein